MAKKRFKNKKLEQNELEPMTIGIFESHRKSSISIFIILTLFILVVIFLPEISVRLSEYLESKGINAPLITNPKPEENEPPKEEEELIFYDITPDLSVNLNYLILNNFVINEEDNTISYSITNSSNNQVDLTKQNYYLEFYNYEQTLLERLKLTHSSNIGTKATYNFTRKLKTDEIENISKLTFTLKSYEEYPSFNPQTTEDGKSSLTCTSLDTTHKITYNFQNNALSNIVSSIDLASTIPDYEQIALNYQTQALTYNSKPGIISNFLIFNEGFNVTTNVDLSVASRSYIFEADTFSKNTEPKVVKFEMESQGYTCN